MTDRVIRADRERLATVGCRSTSGETTTTTIPARSNAATNLSQRFTGNHRDNYIQMPPLIVKQREYVRSGYFEFGRLSGWNSKYRHVHSLAILLKCKVQLHEIVGKCQRLIASLPESAGRVFQELSRSSTALMPASNVLESNGFSRTTTSESKIP